MTKNRETLVHEPGARPRPVDIDGHEIAEILLKHGAPPRVAAAMANAIIDYLTKLHRDAGAQGLQ